MNTLAIDLETYSSVDISKSGLYRYIESPDFEILLFAYKLNDNNIEVVDLTKDELPLHIIDLLNDDNTLKTAFNAEFEYQCLCKYLGYKLDINQWEDTMFRAAYCGYPTNLKNVAIMLGFGEEEQKDKAGKKLIDRFSKPRTPTKNDSRTRVLPTDDPEGWDRFKDYNKQDVLVESLIRKKLLTVNLPTIELDAWRLNQKVQQNGIKIDARLVQAATDLDESETQRLKEKICSITGVDNPKSSQQMCEWFSNVLGEPVSSMRKEVIPDLRQKCEDLDRQDAIEVLDLRNGLNKTSLKKYDAMKNMIGNDGKVRGILQFYGAKTGRWAGRGIQVQNFPRNYLSYIETARDLFINGDFEILQLIYTDDITSIASQLLRTAIIPDEGHLFAVADYSAIEARVLAWLADEKWRIKVFRETGKIYEASAAQLFNADFEKICDKDAPEHALRAQGKIAELALGYQGSVGSINKFDSNHAIADKDKPNIVKQWRNKSPNIVQLWWDCQNAAIEAIKTERTVILKQKGIKFEFLEDLNRSLTITLPSKRKLFYPDAKIVKGKWGQDSVSFLGIDQKTRKIERIQIYGGKFVENITSAIARDCLSEALLKLDRAGYDIKFHVHDEVILEVEENSAQSDLDRAISLMCESPEWAPDLLLNAEGFISPFYKKD